MFSHVMVGTNDMDRSKRFYDSVFGEEGVTDYAGRLVYRRNGAVFMISKPIDGQPANQGNGWTVGFNFDSPEEVEAWHNAGVENGGRSVEDPPGYRERPYGQLYLAYLRDPDGNKLCGLHRPAK